LSVALDRVMGQMPLQHFFISAATRVVRRSRRENLPLKTGLLNSFYRRERWWERLARGPNLLDRQSFTSGGVLFRKDGAPEDNKALRSRVFESRLHDEKGFCRNSAIERRFKPSSLRLQNLIAPL
jgi:hypothetical protein